MMRLIILIALILIPQASFADENDAVCRVLKKQMQNSANYLPGVDAYGRPVIAAEGSLPALTADLPRRIKVPLSLDLAQQIPSLQSKGLEINMDLGSIEVDAQGQVFRGDEDITEHALEQCNLPLDPNDLVIQQESNNNLQYPQEIFGRNVQDIQPTAGTVDDTIQIETLKQPKNNFPEIIYDEIDDLLYGE